MEKKKEFIASYVLVLFCCFIGFAQNPNWSINRADFEFQMQFTAVLKVDGAVLTNPNDQVGVFVDNELRGFGNVTFDSEDQKYVSFFTAYANTIGETLSFKIFNSTKDSVVDALQTQTFIIDERVGGVFQSLVLSNTTLNNEAELLTFDFQGITANSNIKNGSNFDIVVPSGTDLTSLTPVFSVSSGAIAFINFVKQTSASATVDFTSLVTYQVLSEDEKVLKEYTINVSVENSSGNPTVLISSPEGSVTNKKQFQITISFSEAVTGFSVEDFQISNGVITNLTTTTAATYSALITNINQGNTTISILPNAVLNASAIGNLSSNTFTILFDNENPVLQSQEHSSTNQYFDITFSEAVENVSIEDFVLLGKSSSLYSLNTIQKISDVIYRISYSGLSVSNNNLFLQIKSTSNIIDFANNAIVTQEKETYFLNNTDNYFTSVSGNWSDANNWSLERLPISKDRITINATANTVADVTDFTVQKITNLGTTVLEKSNSISVEEFENTGTFIMNSDRNTSGSLLVKSNATGSVIFKKGELLANKWHLISVPVQGQNIKQFAEEVENNIRVNNSVTPNRFAISFYDDTQSAENKWQYYTSEIDENISFSTGQGYAISRATNGEISVQGTLNIGDVQKNVVPNKWNAIGNPYLTYYPLNKNGNQNFITENIEKLAIPAAYAWDSIQEKYVAYTNLAITETNIIPAGKGFFIKASNTTTVNFTKEKQTVNTSDSELKIMNTTPFVNLYCQKGKTKVSTAILFSDTATNGFDSSEDIENFNGATFDVNTHLVKDSEGKNFTIQSLPKSEIDQKRIPLSIKANKNDEIIFSANKVDFPTGVELYLEDVKNNSFTELTSGIKHTITILENTNGIGRFYLHSSNSVLNTNQLSIFNIELYITNNVLYIKGLQEEKAVINLYNVLGKHILSIKINADTQISLQHLTKAIYVVELIQKNNKIRKKISTY